MSVTAPPVPPGTTPVTTPSGPSDPRRRRVSFRRTLAGALVLLLLVPVASFARAMLAPGSATWQVRAVTWVRDHGGDPVVNAAENWYYRRQAPPAHALPAPGTVPPVGAIAGADAPPPPRSAASSLLPGETTWQAVPEAPGTATRMWTTWLRPDPSMSSAVAGVATWDQSRTRLVLAPGFTEPGRVPGAWPAKVPTSDRPALLATFNSGFKMRDSNGGFEIGGHTVRRLVPGAASVIVNDTGQVDIRAWRGGATSVLPAVRQNLKLLVDQGQPVPGLTNNHGGAWGYPDSQLQWTWRSGLGITADNRLVYVAGKLPLLDLARALADAGSVRALPLDMHTAMVAFTSFGPGAAAGSGTPLLPGLARQAGRYLQPDSRDFFAVLRAGRR